ncbi:MAG: RNA methyltransferase [Chloroflexota bacterium]
MSLIETFRRTATAKGRAQSGLFGVEGVRLVERGVRAEAEIVQILTTETFADVSTRHAALLADIHARQIPTTIIPSQTMRQLIQGRQLGDILAIVRQPAPPDLGQLAQETACLLLAAVDVVDPGNVGAMVRTAHALGGTAVITVGVSDAYHPKAARTSMGSLFKLPILYYENRVAMLAAFKQHEIQMVATVATGGRPLAQAKLPRQKLAVLMGNEYWGLEDEVLTAVQHKVTIPMASDIDSFSVNAAAAIALYEIGRSRHSGAEPMRS